MSQIFTIDHLGAQGDGVIVTADGPIYAAMTAPGDRVRGVVDEQAKGGRRLTAVEIDSPGALRRDAVCRHFGSCGGCSLQHVNPDHYRGWLPTRIASALGQQGLADVEIRPPTMSPEGSRRRVLLGAQHKGKAVVLGFRQRQSHQLVDVGECPVCRGEIVTLFTPLRAILRRVLSPGDKANLRLTVTASGIDLVIEGPRGLDLEGREALADFADAQDLAALTWSDGGFDDPVAIRRTPVMRFGDLAIGLPPGAFLQATAEGEAALVSTVLDATGPATLIADLFCGLGTFTLPLAQRAPVLAVEGSGPVVTALDQAVRQAAQHGLKPIRTLHRDLFRRPMTAAELAKIDVVVFDPPRAGAAAQVKELAQSQVPRVIAVSCNPNTFARDARLLAKGGYALNWVQPVDQFLYSPHLELVAVFDRV